MRLFIIMPLIVLLFVFFLISCFFKYKERKLYLQIQRLEQETYLNEDEEYNIKKDIRKLKREKRKCRKKYSIYLVCVMALEACTIPWFISRIKNGEDSSLEKTSQNIVNDIFLAVGGVEGNYDPAQIINIENERTDEETVTALFNDGLFFSLYEEIPKTESEKRQLYVKYVDGLMNDDKEPQISIMGNGINQTEKTENEIYDDNIKQLIDIENSKVPDGYTREDVEKGLVMPLTVSADAYMWEYEMRWQCYIIKPTMSMLQQTAKAAEDATILLSVERYRVEEMVKYAGYAVTHYLCLTRFDGAGESKADCCYWIAKLYCVLSESLPKEWDNMIEHCKLMSYAFCEKGVDYLNTLKEKNDHGNDLLELRDEMDSQTAP